MTQDPWLIFDCRSPRAEGKSHFLNDFEIELRKTVNRKRAVTLESRDNNGTWFSGDSGYQQIFEKWIYFSHTIPYTRRSATLDDLMRSPEMNCKSALRGKSQEKSP